MRVNSKENVQVKHYTEKNEVDYFCTFIQGRCYIVLKFNECSDSKTLRFVPTKNGKGERCIFRERLRS